MLFDDIYHLIGEFGTYQFCVYFIGGLTGFMNGINNMAVTFSAAKMDHWCRIPALSNFTHDTQKYVAVPFDDIKQQYSQCRMYDLPYENYTTEDILGWNKTTRITSNTTQMDCTDWVFDQSVFVSTIRSKWNLVCGQDSRSQLVQTFYMVGFLFGSALFGQLSDRIGRLKTMVIAMIVLIIAMLAGALTRFYWVYCMARLLAGAGVSGGFTIFCVVVMEIIGKKYRVAAGIMAHSFFALGMILISWLSWAIRDNAKLEFALFITTAAFLLIFIITPESPRWLLGVGRDQEAETLLRKMAAINGRTLPDDLNLDENREEAKEHAAEKATVLDLLRGSYIRSITINMWFCWTVTCISFYGLSLGVSFLQGSLFINNTISALVQIPVYIMLAVSLDRTGRRWPLIISYIIMGLCSILCIPVIGKPDYNWLFTTFLMIGKAFGAGTFAHVYLYASELFPTVARNAGVGSSSTMARVGGLIQPQIALTESIWPGLPFLVYGVISLMAGVTSFFLPETLGRKLPETLEDVRSFRKRIRTISVSLASQEGDVEDAQNLELRSDITGIKITKF